MEFFFNPITNRVEQLQANNNLPFRSMADMANEINQFPFLPPNSTTPLDAFKNTVAPVPPFNPQSFKSIFPTTGIMSQAPRDFKRFEGITKETDIDDDTLDTVEETKTGIEKLFEFLNMIPTPLNLIRGGLESLGGFNQRLRNTDFGRSKTLADYFDARKYGGFDARERARQATMAQARGIQKSIDKGDFGGSDISIDRARGSIASRSSPTTSKRDTSPSSSYSQASYGRRG